MGNSTSKFITLYFTSNLDSSMSNVGTVNDFYDGEPFSLYAVEVIVPGELVPQICTQLCECIVQTDHLNVLVPGSLHISSVIAVDGSLMAILRWQFWSEIARICRLLLHF